MLPTNQAPETGQVGDRLNEGERFYNLSDKTPEEAETLWQGLSSFITYPFLMPDGTIRRPPGQTSDDRLDDDQVNLACAYRATVERIGETLRDRISHNRHAQAAIDLLDEASLYLGLAIDDQDREFPSIPW